VRKRRDLTNFPLVPVILLAGCVVFAWAAVQAWVYTAPPYGLATAGGGVIGALFSYFFFGWLKRKKSEPHD
jgi:hypothetical protein